VESGLPRILVKLRNWLPRFWSWRSKDYQLGKSW
jgi:hypothetical protein